MEKSRSRALGYEEMRSLKFIQRQSIISARLPVIYSYAFITSGLLIFQYNNIEKRGPIKEYLTEVWRPVMFCLYCGVQNSDDAVFCRSCGRRQKRTGESILPVPPLPQQQAAIPRAMPGWLKASGHLSRRVVITGLLGGAAVVAGGAATLLVLSKNYPSSFPASTSNSTSISSSPLGTILYTYHGHSGTVFGVAWSPDGKRIASASYDTTVQVWDAIDGGNVYTYRGHSKPVPCIAWSPDGKRIASGSTDTTVQVWQAR
jgi:WD domain, G-beta repeat